MYKIFTILVLIFTVTLSASDIEWSKDYKAAIEQAKKVNKPVLFVSSRHTCKYCVILDNTTFKDDRVTKELNKNFVSVISYSDDGDHLPRELWTPGTPALWFLMPDGKPIYQPLMGAVDANNFLKALSIVKEEFNKGKTK